LPGRAGAGRGLTSPPGRYQAPYRPAWSRLWLLPPPKSALAFQLTRLFHYCSANGIQPEHVNDEVLQEFYAALTAESLVENPYEAYRGAAKSWNNAMAQIPGWPGPPVSVPSKRAKPFSLAWTDFPASLHEQVEAHLVSLAGIDLDGDFTRPMRPATIETRRRQLLWLASALVRSGLRRPR